MPDLPDLRLEQREAASGALAGALRRRIMLGGFALGSKLPTERDLALGLGVSRNTVRQAMRILAAEGLISTSRGRNGGSVVEPPAVPPRSRREIATAWRQSIDDAYRFRLALEPLAARWAAERPTAPQRAGLADAAGPDRPGRLPPARFPLPSPDRRDGQAPPAAGVDHPGPRGDVP